MPKKIIPAEPEPGENTFVWLRTAPDINGIYRSTLEIDDDHSVFLTREGALAHASYVLAQVGAAEHDAKVYLQLAHLGDGDPGVAVEVIALLRQDRPTLTAPTALGLKPGVNQQGKPFLTVHVDQGEPIGQWSLEDARSHALGCLESVAIADYDAAYLRTLMRVIGLDEETARGAVAALADIAVSA